MNRNTDYQFIPTDTEALETYMVAVYERLMGVVVRPASPEKLFIQYVTSIILQERVQSNYAANQNVPSRASGENLDALGDLFYITARPEAKPATCTVRFTISEAQQSAILVPAGTRVRDSGNTLVWQTTVDAYISPGETYIDLRVSCQTPGTVGNGYAIGQINTIVDVFDYYLSCSNTTESGGGSNRATDEEYYELMRESMDAKSTAGAIGTYIYFAKQASTEIGDVIPNSPSPGEVRIYVLMKDGTAAGEEVKKAVLAACNGDEVRAFTDKVSVEDPETVSYDINLTYYVPSDSTENSAAIQAAVDAAIEQYVAWQCGKFGRDINPSKLYQMLMATGIKRLELTSPQFTVLRDGKLDPLKTYELSNTIPQVAVLGEKTIVNGGYEDE